MLFQVTSTLSTVPPGCCEPSEGAVSRINGLRVAYQQPGSVAAFATARRGVVRVVVVSSGSPVRIHGLGIATR